MCAHRMPPRSCDFTPVRRWRAVERSAACSTRRRAEGRPWRGGARPPGSAPGSTPRRYSCRTPRARPLPAETIPRPTARVCLASAPPPPIGCRRSVVRGRRDRPTRRVVVEDAIDRAVAPAIVARTCCHARLPRAIAIAIVGRRGRTGCSSSARRTSARGRGDARALHNVQLSERSAKKTPSTTMQGRKGREDTVADLYCNSANLRFCDSAMTSSGRSGAERSDRASA